MDSIDDELAAFDALVMEIIENWVQFERVCRRGAARSAQWLSRKNETRADKLDDAIYRAGVKSLALANKIEMRKTDLTEDQSERFNALRDALDDLTKRWIETCRVMQTAADAHRASGYSIA